MSRNGLVFNPGDSFRGAKPLDFATVQSSCPPPDPHPLRAFGFKARAKKHRKPGVLRGIPLTPHLPRSGQASTPGFGFSDFCGAEGFAEMLTSDSAADFNFLIAQGRGDESIGSGNVCKRVSMAVLVRVIKIT